MDLNIYLMEVFFLDFVFSGEIEYFLGFVFSWVVVELVFVEMVFEGSVLVVLFILFCFE